MHGQSIACSVSEALFFRSPQPSFFDRLRFSAPEFARRLHLLEASASQRPFTRPQRLFPFENHRHEVKRSWPIASTEF